MHTTDLAITAQRRGNVAAVSFRPRRGPGRSPGRHRALRYARSSDGCDLFRATGDGRRRRARPSGTSLVASVRSAVRCGVRCPTACRPTDRSVNGYRPSSIVRRETGSPRAETKSHRDARSGDIDRACGLRPYPFRSRPTIVCAGG